MWMIIKEMPDIIKLTAISETYGKSSYGSGLRKDVVNQYLEFNTEYVLHKINMVHTVQH